MVATTELVAREAELATLQRLADSRTSSAAVLVTGARGVGKSALVERLCRERPAALFAQAAAWETDRPYGVLSQLFGGSADVNAADRLADAFAGCGADLVVIDDAQWCDPETLQTVSTAIRHHPRAAQLVVLVRADGPVPDQRANDLIERMTAETVVLRPFDAAGVHELAEAHGVHLHPSLAGRLCAHTGGIPCHVLALLTEMPADFFAEPDPPLPPTAAIRSSTQARMARCGAQALALVEAVAILRSPAPLTEACALAELAEPLAPLDEAVRAGLLTSSVRRGARVLALDGPLRAAAVLEQLGVARRVTLHARAAELVEDPIRVLEHEAEATLLPDPGLADRLDALAVEHAELGAWSSAGELLTKASRLTTEPRRRDERLTRAVDAFVGAGDLPRAVAFIAEIESLRETSMRNAVLGYLAILRGRPTEAQARLSRAWDLVVPEREPEVAALVCQRYVLHSLANCQAADLVRWADRAIELGGMNSPAGVEASVIRGLGVAGSGKPAEGAASYADVAARVPDGAQGQRAQMGLGWLNLVLDRVDESVAGLESAVSTDFLGGSERISLWARAWLARAQFASGEWDTALRTVRDAQELADRTGITLMTPLIQWTAAQVHSLRGDDAAAVAALRRGAAGVHDYAIMRVPSCLARAHHAEARADYAGVVQALTPLTEQWAGGSIDEPGFWPWPDIYANALVLENRYDEAETFLNRHEAIARKRSHRSAQARLGYARGRLLGARGDIDAAKEAFEKALALLAELPLPFDKARVNFAYGQTLRRAGKRREADVVMTTSRELYAELGAETYVLRCDRELKAGGVHAVRGERDLDELTPQERVVSELVARGHSNREVAAELFLSSKTVQYHLTRIYWKLGIRSRGELAALWSARSD